MIKLVVFVLSALLAACGTSHNEATDAGMDADVAPARDTGPPDTTPRPIMVRCGDGLTGPGEMCDDGNHVDGDRCDNDCTFSCTENTDCANDNPCLAGVTCDTARHVCVPGPSAADGSPCGDDVVCRAGLCSPSTCGDGMVQAPEDCDDANIIAEDGCEPDCTFTCTDDVECGGYCAGAVCVPDLHLCRTSSARPDGDVCERDGDASTRDICRERMCESSICGDGYVDREAGEDCDDGDRGGCSATCGSAVINYE